MPVAGPCANPDCFTPDQASQWQYVPEAFAGARRPDTTCVCKKAGCLRWCGLRGPKQVPGRKRATGEAGLAAGAAAHRAPDELHCPPIIRSIDEIWAVRCAALPRTCAFFTFSHLFSRLALLCPLLAAQVRRHRRARRGDAREQAALRRVQLARVRRPRQVRAQPRRQQRLVRHLVHRPQRARADVRQGGGCDKGGGVARQRPRRRARRRSGPSSSRARRRRRR